MISNIPISQQRAIAILVAIILIVTVVVKVVMQTERAYEKEDITFVESEPQKDVSKEAPLKELNEKEKEELKQLMKMDL